MSQAGKGHVPEENLLEYRKLASMARRFDTLGNELSNLGHYPDANKLWGLSGAFWGMANELRVDLPTK